MQLGDPILLPSKRCVLEVIDRLLDIVTICSELLDFYEKTKLTKAEKLEFKDEMGSLLAYCWGNIINIQMNCQFDDMDFQIENSSAQFKKWNSTLRPNPDRSWGGPVITTEIPDEGKPYICSDKRIAIHVLTELERVRRSLSQAVRLISKRKYKGQNWTRTALLFGEIHIFCTAISNTFYFDHPDLIKHEIDSQMVAEELDSIERIKIKTNKPQMVQLFRSPIGLEKFRN